MHARPVLKPSNARLVSLASPPPAVETDDTMRALRTDLPGIVGQRLEVNTMIESVEEFVRLRTGFDRDNILRSATEPAAARVWLEIIARYPGMRRWVAHNTTVSAEILDLLGDSEDREGRW